MYLQDLHTHSLYDDGAHTLAAMAQRAILRGADSLGFSGHSPLPFDNDWSIAPAAFDAYLHEARALQQSLAPQLSVFCGLEWDACSPLPTVPLDFMIGSVHYFPALPDSTRYSVDCSAAMLDECRRVQFAGDVRAQEDCYYDLCGALADIPSVDIVGHFDLITKFDEPHAIYSRAPQHALRAMERLAAAGKIFEVNTGALSRGYRETPYPSELLLRYLRELDGKILFSSDSHNTDTLFYQFDAAAALAKACGFEAHWILTADGFIPERL